MNLFFGIVFVFLNPMCFIIRENQLTLQTIYARAA